LRQSVDAQSRKTRTPSVGNFGSLIRPHLPDQQNCSEAGQQEAVFSQAGAAEVTGVAGSELRLRHALGVTPTYFLNAR
jgi:hypothetical protein